MTLDGIVLPDDLVWSNQFSWLPVSQSTEQAVNGALIVQEAVKLKGRTIKLRGGEDYAWITLDIVKQLQSLASTPANEIVLVHRGINYNVIFDHSIQALEINPVIDYADPDNTDRYSITINLIEV